jgi:hypothetical protein
MQLDAIRRDIEYRRQQISRQRKDIQSLERLGISTVPANELLERMLKKVDELCVERDRLRRLRYLSRRRHGEGLIMRPAHASTAHGKIRGRETATGT